MRKIATIIAVLVFGSVFACSAQEVIYIDDLTATVSFLSDMINADNTPIKPDTTITHEIYIFNDVIGDIRLQAVEDLTLLTETPILETVVEIPDGAYWAVAVRTKEINKYGEAAYSEFSYSIVPEDTHNGIAVVIANISMQNRTVNKPTMIWIR